MIMYERVMVILLGITGGFVLYTQMSPVAGMPAGLEVLAGASIIWLTLMATVALAVIFGVIET